MRWIWIAIACAGCPANEAVPSDDTPVTPPPLPRSNCAVGTAPPITFCHQVDEDGSTVDLSTSGALSVQDWVTTGANAAGHVETLYGDGFPIERYQTGTFASQMTTVCSETGRVQIEASTHATERSYFDTANRYLSWESDGNLDGVFDERNFNIYDGDLLVRSYSDDGPGTPPKYIWSYAYDERGRVHVVTGDDDGDGEIDETQQRDWDDLDREIDEITFQHGEETGRWTWTYEGALLTATEIAGQYRWTRRYDDRSRQIATEFFDIAADHLDELDAIRYDGLDRQVEVTQDDGADGTIERRRQWSYCD